MCLGDYLVLGVLGWVVLDDGIWGDLMDVFAPTVLARMMHEFIYCEAKLLAL